MKGLGSGFLGLGLVFVTTIVLGLGLVWVNIERVDLAYELKTLERQFRKGLQQD